MKSVDAMAVAMKNATKAMTKMNARLNIPQLTGIMRSFGIESSKMEDTTEMMGEAMDDIFAVSDEEAEEDDIVKQVMTELKLEMDSSIPMAPSSSLSTGVAGVAAVRAPTAVGAMGGAGVAPRPTAGAGVPPPTAGAGTGGSGKDDGPGGGAGVTAPAPAPAPGGGDLASRLASLRAEKGPGDSKPPT